jgi:penicillin-binding protein 1C
VGTEKILVIANAFLNVSVGCHAFRELLEIMTHYKRHRALYTSFTVLVLLTMLSATAFYRTIRSEAHEHPVHAADIPPFHSLKIKDRHDILLQEVRCRDGRSEPVGLKKISAHFIKALIAAEDRRFYEHDGVDWKAAARAAIQNMLPRHQRSGASTITLQLAKMLEPGPRTLGKKLHEVRLAYRLEAGMTKNEILEQYISRLPFGNQLYGIESASRTYFRKPAADLSLAQATLLAAIPNAPSELDPYKKIEQVRSRQAFILNRMKALRSITSEDRQLALGEIITVHEPERPRLAPHFIRRLLSSLPGTASTVKTTLDSGLQRAVEQQARDVLFELKGRVVSNAAVLVLDNRNGEVLAYAGSADFDNRAAEGQNDGIQALRQPGSTLKPFIYGLALERGMTPATLLQDLEVHFATPVGDFSPQNYSRQFHGPVRLREALANSLNVPAVRVTAELGPDAVLKRLREYGFGSLSADAEHYGVGLALGDGEVTLYELTRAYMALARGGSLVPVREQAPAVSQKRRVQRELAIRVSSPEAVYLITSILKDPYARATEFGPDSVLRMPFPCAVKTGTSRNYRDNWAMGYTRNYTVGVWVGNFNGVPMQQVAGVSGAGPLFHRVMLMLHDKAAPQDFEQPKGLVEVEVCALSGKKRGPDCPHGVNELFLSSSLEKSGLAPCDVHRRLLIRNAEAGSANEYRVIEDLPPVYEPWQRQTNRPMVPREFSHYAKSNLFEIVRPASGSLYKRPIDLAPAYQTLRFEAIGAPARAVVIWLLNGHEVGRTNGRHYLDWSVQAGSFRLRAETTEGQISEVRFSVD